MAYFFRARMLTLSSWDQGLLDMCIGEKRYAIACSRCFLSVF